MKWKPIKSCPDEDYDVLVFCVGGRMKVVKGKDARAEHYIDCAATHWMLLPGNPNDT